jgi:hypothetical protein
MARGFESKSVESQQEEFAKRRSSDPVPRDAAPAVDPAAGNARRTVELALKRAEADLAASTSPAHRAMLEHAITALSKQLETM